MEWITLLLEMPAYQKTVLVRCKDGRMIIAALARKNNKWMSGVDRLYFDEVTHWMPLPAPPKGY
jgi:hypothetical protein